MPRRKATRGKGKPVTGTDPDASIMADGEDKLQQRKELFLRDFDIQVKARINQMDTEMKQITTETTKIFTQAKIGIPKHIRSMTVAEFLSAGGRLASLELNEVADIFSPNVSFSERAADQENLAPASTASTPAVPATNGRVSRKRVAAAVCDLEINRPATAKRPTRTTRKKPSVQPSMTPLPKPTPALPLITPKFDLREPVTTARKAKLGETTISMAGSPVVNDSSRKSMATEDNLLSLTLNKQQTLLGGSLFDASTTMSPGTLISSKERLQEAMDAINSKLSGLGQTMLGTQESSI